MGATVFRAEVKAKSAPSLGGVLALLGALVLSATIGPLTPSADAAASGAGGVGGAPGIAKTPFGRQGSWIWYVDRSHGGSVPAIARQAKRAGIGTLYIKAGDGGNPWTQFSRGLVRALHRGGLSVCAWQFVYGDRPAAEARVAAGAVAKGADCFVIDAEGAYEGRYAAADLYVRRLRARIGARFPLSLAAFPYADYHPSFPYSVFFGPGGATFNQPQMYWKTIGTSVREVFEHTYLHNRIWGHPIYPLGQTYEAPGRASLKLFRRFAASYGGLAPSWWSWQETAGREWGALGARTAARPVTGYRMELEHPLLRRGSKGDMVVWAQQLLVGSGQEVPVTGLFGRLTARAVRSFQEAQGLLADGRIGTETWESLLRFEPHRVRWSGSRARLGGGATGSRVRPPSRPLSASLGAKSYEIVPGPAP
jgi:peptidoglycan hydrolase-like protein with peptidoglycan-binding domain